MLAGAMSVAIAWHDQVMTDDRVKLLLLLGNGFKDDLVGFLLLHGGTTLLDRHGTTCALLL